MLVYLFFLFFFIIRLIFIHPFFLRCFSLKVVNSPLFKTAIAGNDPNVGRLLSAVGKAMYRLAS